METPASSPGLPDEFISAEGIRRLFGVTDRTVSTWIACGKLPAPMRIGHKSYWDPRELREVLDRSKEATTGAVPAHVT